LALNASAIGEGFGVVDTIITPDPVNPNITVTSSSGPNPFPGATLLSASDLQTCEADSKCQQELINIGILPMAADTPEPTSFLPVGTALLVLVFSAHTLRRSKKSARPTA
jgi:hypothetical protein